MFKPCRHTARVRGRRSSDASTPVSPPLCARFARGISALDGRARGLLIATTVALVTLSILIFFFSAEGGAASSVRSDAIARALASLFAPDIDTWDSLARKAFISDLRFFVRKAAHATEYAALGALWFAELHQLARALADDAARTAACASARTMRHALTMRHARTMRSVHTAGKRPDPRSGSPTPPSPPWSPSGYPGGAPQCSNRTNISGWGKTASSSVLQKRVWAMP